MSRAFKFRYVNEIAGGFVLLGIVLLLIGFYIAGHAQGWFEHNLELYTTFTTAEGTFGLQEGAEIRILGTLAGRVTQIKPGEQGGMVAKLVVKGRFRNFVRKDSIGKVKKKFAVAGDSYIDISLGTVDAGLLRSGDSIQCVQDVELIETARKMLDDVRDELVPLLEQFHEILTNVRSVTTELQRGEGTVGRLINDKDLAAQLQAIVLNVHRSTEELPVIMERADAAVTNANHAMAVLDTSVEKLPGVMTNMAVMMTEARLITSSLTGEVAGVQGVMLEAQQTLREAERLIVGLQNNWLIRGGMEVPTSTELLPPPPLPLPEPKGATP